MISGVKTFVEYQGRYLLLKRHESIIYGGQWDIPGGAIEYKESTINAAVREIKEEINIDIKTINLKPLDIINYTRVKDSKTVEIEFYITNIDNIDDLKLSPEHTELMWVEVDQLFELLEIYQKEFNIKRIIYDYIY